MIGTVFHVSRVVLYTHVKYPLAEARGFNSPFSRHSVALTQSLNGMHPRGLAYVGFFQAVMVSSVASSECDLWLET